MTNWKNIHSDFTSELQKEWEERNFNYEQAKEWIDSGLRPNEADLAVFLIDQEYTAEEILNNNDIDIEKLREEYSNDNQKKFCCKHSKQANNLVTLAISRITGKSENDIGKRKTLIFGSSRLYDAIDDYKSWMSEAIELLQKAEGEMKNCNCVEKKKGESSSLQKNLKGKEDELKKSENELKQKETELKETKVESNKLNKSLTEKDNQLISTRTQLQETQEKLTNLGIEEKKKVDKITSLTSSLKEKEIEAAELKRTAKQDELDKLTDELNISRDFKKKLKNDYERLVKAKKNREEDVIDEAEENIDEIKEELKEKGISRDNIKKVCELYEEVAKLQLDLKQVRNQLRQHEAKIETNLLTINK